MDFDWFNQVIATQPIEIRVVIGSETALRYNGEYQ